MCEWISNKMPWLVAHVGGAPLAVQIALAFALLAAIVLGYYGMRAALCTQHVSRPRRPGRFNWLSRWLAMFSDDEPFEDWMDADVYEAGEI